MNNKINLCIANYDNYSKYASVVIASILKNADLNGELLFNVYAYEWKRK